jgi:serine/threonine protein phosphatase PrpC
MVPTQATAIAGRETNEDAMLVRELAAVGAGDSAIEGGYLLAIADGMGGYQRGEVASQMAIQVIDEMFANDPGADTALLLKQAFRRANDRIYENGQGAVPPAMMGTTMVVAAMRGKYATIGSIGDSRAYLVRANRITQITKDHSLVAEQVAQGAMTADEARESPHRNILLHALGHRPKLDSKMPNIFEIMLLPEDRLLICTDGFFDVMSDSDLLNLVTTTSVDSVAKRLVDTAVERGASDNVTAVVISVQPAREPSQLITSSQGGRMSPLVLGAIAAVILIILIAAYVLTQ